MTPAARIAAAIAILDEVLAGEAAEKALTGWARRSRFAGSGDRAALRDHVFDALRCRRSFAALGGAATGRGLMLGALRAAGTDPDTLFTGQGHAPPPLTTDERAGGHVPADPAERLDVPDWLWPKFRDDPGADAEAVAAALQTRAPVHLRANLLKTDRETVQRQLADEGIACRPHPAADTALEVTEGARRIRQSAAYTDGLVELQDAASQAVAAALPLRDGMRVLDYCAGGGGKALAMAARARLSIWAHDAAPGRMRDLPARAQRAGAAITCVDGDGMAQAAPFDLVLCDVPCSGSGAWRRAPEAKWRLTPARLAELGDIQALILESASGLVAAGGVLAYATCSLFGDENDGQIDRFLARTPGWTSVHRQRWTPVGGTDGFFLALLTRA
jgi:16S rRNA (cytosine967-C5)-methyltransferase